MVIKGSKWRLQATELKFLRSETGMATLYMVTDEYTRDTTQVTHLIDAVVNTL
jgi:hypothetical protein